ncbi:MAG: ACT domain-containing protein, partial [Alphaproteobacteria bacterium]
LVAVEGMALEAELAGAMLFVRNRDKPGFIGALGRALGDAGINIATFHLGRTGAGEDAICLVQVDQPIDEAMLAAVRALPHVVEARTLSFRGEAL